MEELFLSLAKDAPWIALSGWLLWRQGNRENATLDAFKAGVSANQEMGAAIQSLKDGQVKTAERLTAVETQLAILASKLP